MARTPADPTYPNLDWHLLRLLAGRKRATADRHLAIAAEYAAEAERLTALADERLPEQVSG